MPTVHPWQIDVRQVRVAKQSLKRANVARTALWPVHTSLVLTNQDLIQVGTALAGNDIPSWTGGQQRVRLGSAAIVLQRPQVRGHVHDVGRMPRPAALGGLADQVVALRDQPVAAKAVRPLH